MKKLFPILIACFMTAGFSTTPLQAQLLGFGVKGGVNIANFTGTDFDTDSRTGGMLGISVDITPPLFPVGFETGLYYSQKGAELSSEELTTRIETDYLEIPLLARVNMILPGPLTPHLVAGPYVGFNVHAESEFTTGGVTSTEDLSDFVRTPDIGLILGVGSDFHLGIARMNLQARYSLGLQPVFEDALDDGENHGVFHITLGYLF